MTVFSTPKNGRFGRPRKSTKMTKTAGVTQAKSSFAKSTVLITPIQESQEALLTKLLMLVVGGRSPVDRAGSGLLQGPFQRSILPPWN